MNKDNKAYYEQLSKAYFESSVQFDKQILFIASVKTINIKEVFLPDSGIEVLTRLYTLL